MERVVAVMVAVMVVMGVAEGMVGGGGFVGNEHQGSVGMERVMGVLEEVGVEVGRGEVEEVVKSVFGVGEEDGGGREIGFAEFVGLVMDGRLGMTSSQVEKVLVLVMGGGDGGDGVGGDVVGDEVGGDGVDDVVGDGVGDDEDGENGEHDEGDEHDEHEDDDGEEDRMREKTNAVIRTGVMVMVGGWLVRRGYRNGLRRANIFHPSSLALIGLGGVVGGVGVYALLGPVMFGSGVALVIGSAAFLLLRLRST